MSIHFFDISYDIIRHIYYSLDTKTQVILKRTCEYFNMFPIVIIDKNIGTIITDDALLNYQSLKELYIGYNKK